MDEYPNFNEEHYKALYDDLQNMTSIEIRLHWIRIGRFRERHANIYEAFTDFNPKVYQGLYEDLKEMTIEELEIHWLRIGRFKRRKYKIELVYPEYDENIHQILHKETFEPLLNNLQVHWLGLDRKKRKRFLFYGLYPDFNLEMYRLINPNIRNMSDKELQIHWLTIGRKTGMSYRVNQIYPKFNTSTYKLLNKNIEELKNMTEYELEKHWIEKGSKTGLNYSISDMYPEFSIDKYRKLVHQGLDINATSGILNTKTSFSDIELEKHWLDIGRYSDFYYEICGQLFLEDFANTNRDKILVILHNDTTKGINKHTDILIKDLDVDIIKLDDVSAGHNMRYRLYKYVLLQNTFTNMPIKENYQKYVYIVHSDCKFWQTQQKEFVKSNDTLIDLYIFINKNILDSFEKNLLIPKNKVIIENQLDKIENNNVEIKKLYISCGAYEKSANYYTLIDEFSILDKSNELEIYGDIADEEYYNGLKKYIEILDLTNITLLEYKTEYIERLKYAEYFCLFNKNEQDPYCVLEAMALNKKIICDDEYVTSKQLKYYQKRTYSFLTNISVDSYVCQDYMFIDNMKNVILNEKHMKKYIDSLEVIDDVDEDKINKEIQNGMTNLKLSKGLSFLLNIRDDQLHILNNLFQIYPFADEIIIINNGLLDETLDIIDYFNTFYKKVYVYHYKNGVNNLLQKKETLYNWSLSKVTKNNVIKWDGDFEIIKDKLSDMIDTYQLRERTDPFVLWFSGLTKFYNKYINISSHYDDCRCFSKLNGFICVDNHINNKKIGCYISGHKDIYKQMWSSDNAIDFDYLRKPVFIQNKNNNLSTELDDVSSIYTNKEIIFIVILEKSNLTDTQKIDSMLESSLLYIGKDVKYILLYYNDTVDNDKYYTLDSFMERLEFFKEDQLFIYTPYKIDTQQINKNGNVKFIGISYSEISYYNKYFTENNSAYHKIITVNDACYEKYKKLNIENVVLLRSCMQSLDITSTRIFNKECIKILFFSKLSHDKNLIMLMDAIEKLRSENIFVFLDIYSDLDSTTQYYYNQLKYKEFITIKKMTLDKDVYLNYDLCILPSVSEGSSINVLDSINYEIPILCSKNIGNQEIIQEDFPMLELVGLDCCKDDLYTRNYNKILKSIGYIIKDNDLGLDIMKSDKKVYHNNVEEIKQKIQLIINNYAFYKTQIIYLKKKLKSTFFNVKQYIIEINNLLSDKVVVIDYPVN